MKRRKYQNLTELWAEIGNYTEQGAEYHDKMFHDIPDTECADRVIFILQRCFDKTVLDIGCIGDLHKNIEEVAKEVWGIDKDDSDIKNYWKIDIEKDPTFPVLIREVHNKVEKAFDVIICGEILEHLSNPGFFLEHLKHFECPIIITVPNAFAIGSEGWLRKGKECVNDEHVAWYSYYTLKNLVERYGYKVEEFYWAGQPHYFSEGIIMVIKYGDNNGKNK